MSLEILTHPLPPFLPEACRILMLGSFPPPPQRWCIDFYYPNFINDMWRIMGLIYFNDKDYLVIKERKIFNKEKIIGFLQSRQIGIYDTAYKIRRQKDNASDAFLEIVEPTPLPQILAGLPTCQTIITTGTLASETFAGLFNIKAPAVGHFCEFNYQDISRRLWRMPSSSRAYPLTLGKKADFYRMCLPG